MKLLDVNSNIDELVKLIKVNNPFVICIAFIIALFFFMSNRYNNKINVEQDVAKNIANTDIKNENSSFSPRKESMKMEGLILDKLENELGIKIDRYVSKVITMNSIDCKSDVFSGVNYDGENIKVFDV